jgi:alkanesulfonate monooxygenase SsuD/methylene tetrahydromethanopterin reductase-like flavin-dependent oxidoreductase (luciferase family)
MRIGVMLPVSAPDPSRPAPTWPEMRDFALHAEELGVDSVWVCDHLLSGSGEEEPAAIHEAWTVLAALAAATSRVELGQLVMCGSFRSPALLAKMAATADEVSGGRVTLGVGAGWYDLEYARFGFPTDHRVDRFEESLRILCPLVRGESVTFAGRYHRATDAALLPAPARRIPVLVAARRPRMLALTARYADAWNTAWYGLPDDRLRTQFAALDAALDAERRDRTSMRRTVGMIVQDPGAPDPETGDAVFAGSVDELASAFDAYATLGVDDLIVLPLPETRASLDRIGAALRRRAGTA